MGRRGPISPGNKLKRKATNAAKQTVYIALWGQKPPGKYRKDGNGKKK